uniref:Lipoprotein n=1 Tax=Strongyloides papillosus TaxID=174720 RepID=A0A0N5C9M8_STREA
MIISKFFFSIIFFLIVTTCIKKNSAYDKNVRSNYNSEESLISENILMACNKNPELFMCSKILNDNSKKLKHLKNILIKSYNEKNKESADNKNNYKYKEIDVKLSEDVYKCFYQNFDDVCERKKCFCLDENVYSNRICKSWVYECSKKKQNNNKRRKQQSNRQMSDKTNKKPSNPFKLSSLKEFSDFRAKDQTEVHNDLNNQPNFHKFDSLTDQTGVLHRARSRSPWVKPGLWEANPDNPHNRDHANKWFYFPRSVTADWLSGQVYWGGHWAVPAAAVGGTDGFSAVHFPSVGSFLGIDDDYD